MKLTLLSTNYFPAMSLNEVLAELPSLTVAERQLLIRRALDIDEPPLSAEDEALVEKRLAEYRRDPKSAVPLNEMKTRLRSRFPSQVLESFYDSSKAW